MIGGAPAAAVVFAREVDARTREDDRLAGRDPLEDETLYAEVRSEKLGALAGEFDAIHSVERRSRSARSTASSPPPSCGRT